MRKKTTPHHNPPSKGNQASKNGKRNSSVRKSTFQENGKKGRKHKKSRAHAKDVPSRQPRNGEHVHVSLQVHRVRDGVDSAEGVGDLPVEVPYQLYGKSIKVSVVSLQRTCNSFCHKLTSTSALCNSIIAICLPRQTNLPLPKTTLTVC